MAIRLRGDGHHVGEDDSAVTAARENKLVVRVVVADVPYPVEMERTIAQRPTQASSLGLSSCTIPHERTERWAVLSQVLGFSTIL